MTTHTDTRKPGRGWAYIGAILGGSVSIAANIAHSYIPPTRAAAHWAPEPGSVIGSVFWPIALFVAVEILTRIPWPTGRGWTFLRFGGLLPVALVAAVVSYRHLSGLLDHYAEDPLTVTIGPLAVDGLMIMATGALLATGAHLTQPTTPAVEPEPTPAPEPVPAEVPILSVPVPTTVAAPAVVQVPTPEPAPEPITQEHTEPEPEPEPEPELEVVDEPATDAPVFAPWATPAIVPPARINGHNTAEVTA